MGGDPTRVEVNIYGESYVVRAAGVPADHVRNLATSIDERMHELARRRPGLNVTRVAVLTALNLADELWRLREQHGRLLDSFGKRLSDLEAAATVDPEAAAEIPGDGQ